ncbi:Long-chain-fatty-acid--CoA ligase [hydrothermal vent metagenome]|uniref:Long-chain-fatty-acid--CoA ligase n=1 Tax=hydrothermal vent metagenome TaxID=652676 RepID=A0A3B0ZGA5_9ZZZZ
MDNSNESHLVTPEQAGTLSGLFFERVKRTPEALAYRYHDPASETWKDVSWSEAGAEAARWQAALASENLHPGDRVAILMQNCHQWVMFDQAALANGLVVVPLYTQDRAENAAYILQNAGVKVLLIGHQEHWDALQAVWDQLGFLTRIISLEHIDTTGHPDSRLRTVGEWLPDEAELMRVNWDANSLATIVYTSGTTGRPKGVMLSHQNILWNTYRSLQVVKRTPDELFLSFLPLSHTLERTAGYYLPMMLGAAVAYNRSIPQLAEDLLAVRPTILISVPRIFERVYNKIHAGVEEKSPVARTLFHLAVKVGWKRFEFQQGRGGWSPLLILWPLLNKIVASKVMEKLGGRMRLAVVGGAPLPFDVAQLFIGLGLPMIQGYGLTETSPVISVNPIENNNPRGVGCLLEDVEARFSDKDELQIRSPGVMLGYWANEKATHDAIDDDGWFSTGDKAKLENGQLYITGRLKEIIVLANGEKVPPPDMEMAIIAHSLFEQAMVVGDNRPYLSAMLVLNPEQWTLLADKLGVDPEGSDTCNSSQVYEAILERVARQLCAFPGYARIRRVHCQLDPWTIEDGLITPTLKLKRNKVCERYAQQIEDMYKDH